MEKHNILKGHELKVVNRETQQDIFLRAPLSIPPALKIRIPFLPGRERAALGEKRVCRILPAPASSQIPPASNI